MLQYALPYTEQGWFVFPAHRVMGGRCSCGNPGCRRPGRHSCSLASASGSLDPAKLHGWWEQWPDANIGVCLGQKSNLMVLSVTREAGLDDYLDLDGRSICELETATVDTDTGWDLYFKYEPGITLRSGMVGMELSSDGCSTLLPPSVGKDGDYYAWNEPEMRIASLPDWLRPPVIRHSPQATARSREAPSAIPTDSHNDKCA